MSTAGSSNESAPDAPNTPNTPDIPDAPDTPTTPVTPEVGPGNPYLSENPGVCRGAWYERQRNGPNGPGGMLPYELAYPCKECGMVVDYRVPIRDWDRYAFSKDVPIFYPQITPRYQFESHINTMPFNPSGMQQYGCWICFEDKGKWWGAMTITQWYEHHAGHYSRGEIGCLDWYGWMQPKKDCKIPNCTRIHA